MFIYSLSISLSFYLSFTALSVKVGVSCRSPVNSFWSTTIVCNIRKSTANPAHTSSRSSPSPWAPIPVLKQPTLPTMTQLLPVATTTRKHLVQGLRFRVRLNHLYRSRLPQERCLARAARSRRAAKLPVPWELAAMGSLCIALKLAMCLNSMGVKYAACRLGLA